MPVNNDGYLFFLGGSQDAIAIRMELAQEPTEGFPPIAICEHLNVESGRVPVAQERGELHLWSPQVIVVHKTSHEPNDDRTTNCDLVGRSAFSEADKSQSLFHSGLAICFVARLAHRVSVRVPDIPFGHPSLLSIHDTLHSECREQDEKRRMHRSLPT
jgi:hypothetical protein